MNLNHPAIDPGPIRSIDLERDMNTGRIWRLHRATPVMDPHGNQWPDTIPTQPAEACTEVGADAVYSMRRHDRIRYRVALALLLAVAAYLSHIAWPLVAA